MDGVGLLWFLYRILNEVGESELLFMIVKEFYLNGIVFSIFVYDICIFLVVNVGRGMCWGIV